MCYLEEKISMFTCSPQIHKIDLNWYSVVWSSVGSELGQAHGDLYEPDLNFIVGFIFLE